MKFLPNRKDLPSTINLSEVIIWVISLVFFLGIIFSLNLNAQTTENYTQDTLWLRSGAIIPCLILSDDNYASSILIKYKDPNGQILQTAYSFDTIERLKKISTAKDVTFSNSPSYLKIFVGFGGGVPGTYGANASFLLKNNMGGSLSYRSYMLSDYDLLVAYSLCFNKSFDGKKSRRVRFGIEAGPTWVEYSDGVPFSGAWCWGTCVRYTTSQGGGFAFRAKMDLLLSQVVGFELALTGNINTARSVLGIELYLTLGRIRDRIKPKKTNLKQE